MTYITQEDLIEELGERKLIELANDAGTDELDEAAVKVINNAIASAIGTFESYIRTRYSLPVPATPLVKSSCVKLAIYNLVRKNATFDEGVFKVKKTGYDETITLLKDIGAGRAALDVPVAEETIEIPTSGDRILTNAGNTKFSKDNLQGY